ncbi:MAG: CotH kinase family protein [Lachnospiraceae bacterium]|nr:CotH kinase family protein [Lachnospiraceae bacterium]
MKNKFAPLKLQQWTLIAICILMIIYIAGKVVFMESERTQSRNVSSNTSSSTTKTYLAFKNSSIVIGEPITVCIINPPNDTSDWSFIWKVNDKIVKENSTSYTPSEEDNESFITVTATTKQGKKYEASLYLSSLPVLYLDTDLHIRDTYTSGNLSVQGNETYDNENSELYNGGVSVKLRGNSTRYLDKQPYKIKLDDKADLLGMGSSKHWVLLANAIDHTFIRNKLVYDLSGDLGASYSAESDNVVLILNGEYQGVYQLCEQLRISDERINIFDWEGLAEDAAEAIGYKESLNKDSQDALEDALISDFSWISSPYTFSFENKTYNISDYVTIPATTGGFLLEMDFYHLNLQDNTSLQTNFMQPFYFSQPETAGTNEELSDYAKTYIQTFEYALHSSDFVYHDDDTHYKAIPGRFDWNKGWSYSVSPASFSAKEYDGLHYSELFDIDSLINNFLICELTVNWDSMKNSVFISKDIDGLAELNPVWDFDWAFGNDNMYQIYTNFTDIWQTTDNYFTNEQCYQSVQWNRFLIKDPYFLLKVYEKYQEIRPTLLEEIIKEGGILDTYHEELSDAGHADDERWSYSYLQYNGQLFDDAFNSLDFFINERISWLDEQFSSFDNLVNSLGYYKASDKLNLTDIIWLDDGSVRITAQTTDTSASSISFEINGTTFTDSTVINGTASVTVSKDVLAQKEHNIVQIRIKDSAGRYITENTTTKNADKVVTLSNYKVF